MAYNALGDQEECLSIYDSRSRSIWVTMAKDVQYSEKTKGTSRHVTIHPVWHSFIVFCKSMGYGEIEKLKIQNGLPVLAEEARKKIKFCD